MTDCFRRDLVVRNSLNGNLLLNKENRENLESAGELPETDSRMYQTLKRMCHNEPPPDNTVTTRRRHCNTVSHTTGLLQITYCGYSKSIGIVEKLEKTAPTIELKEKQ